MPNLYIETHGRVVLLVHNGMPYTADEWHQIVAIAARRDLGQLRFLVYDDGGTIDTAQRRLLVETMGGQMPKVAVLTHSRVSRGVTTALGWFKPGIKAFAPDQFDKAAAHLDLTDTERTLAHKAADRLQAQLARKTA
jgi:hypothetical protein